MANHVDMKWHRLRVTLQTLAILAPFGICFSGLHAQQAEILRYDLYAGFTTVDAPAIGVVQPGFHTQGGLNMRSWYSLGFDYSVGSGSEILKSNLLSPNLQAAFAAAEQQYIAAGLLPAGYQLAMKTDLFTQIFAAGPQLAYRHFSRTALFIHPSLGAVRERATPRPSDPFATVLAARLVPDGSKTDWTGFYGLGGGFNYYMTKHFGIRVQVDAVYNHPFDDILADGRWTYRYSIGPSFHFGHNILAKRAMSHGTTRIMSHSTSHDTSATPDRLPSGVNS